MAIRGPRRERDGSIVYNSHVPLKQPVAQAKRKHRFRFILTEIDKPFFILVMVLLVFGLLMMFSASYAWGLSEYNDGYYYLVSQLKSAGLGLLLMFATSYLDYHFFQNTKIAYIAFIATYLLTFYTAFFGIDVAGARRWIQIGPISFQPSELLKVTFIIIFAYIMSVNYPKFKDWKFCVIPFTVIMGAVALVLVLQRHMSAVMLVGIIGVSMMFISGMPKKTFWKFIGVCAVFGVLLLIYKMASGSGFSYISDRIQSWKNPESDPSGKTFQTYESLLSIGSGGWFGLGFGESRQKYYLPESQNDFVFAIICEELGVFGVIVMMTLFGYLLYRIYKIAQNAWDIEGKVLAIGVFTQIALQLLINVMVVTSVIPTTGVTLPFFSAGGTSVVFLLAELGMVLNVDKYAKERRFFEEAERHVAQMEERGGIGAAGWRRRLDSARTHR